MQPTLMITVGGEEFRLESPTVQEVRNVKRWTGFASRPAWFSAALAQDGDALLACYVIAKRRKGEQINFDDATDFEAKVEAKFVDGEGREVEQVMHVKPDGSVLLDEDGDVVPVLDQEGNPQWRDVESGTVIPFRLTTMTPTSESSTEPTNDGATDTGIQTTEVS